MKIHSIRMSCFAFLAASAILLLPAGFCPAEAATVSKLTREWPILISTWNSVNDPSAGTELYMVDPDRSNSVTRIPVPPQVERSFGPWWSNDGQWVYYQAKLGTQYFTARCRKDGSEHAFLTVGLGPMATTTNLMADNRDGNMGVADMVGSNYQYLAAGNAYMVSISADGNKVIYSTYGTYYMKSVDVKTKAITALASPTATMGQPSPDNQWVVFTRGVNSDVFRVPLAGGTTEQLTSGASSHNWWWYSGDTHGSSDPPKVSPDSSRIVYGSKVGGIDQVFVMDINGANKRQLTSLPGVCGRRHWNRNGTRVAFISWVGNNAQVFVVDLKPGSTPVQLTNFGGNVKAGMLTWAHSNGLY